MRVIEPPEVHDILEPGPGRAINAADLEITADLRLAAGRARTVDLRSAAGLKPPAVAARRQ